ncbi:hypothetical protein AKI39_19275 [Bordetella sp. H567]|uniref:hypothetical protein n=1 Tax=Bordetella sp. H567 TaxID=1697043 RepID=UPI00081C51B7|nr:hypothetical protein [Bordetella sp. H567]AOB32405.1 hypothetical protein AKI39_19275 [Bordetella sp. H567]
MSMKTMYWVSQIYSWNYIDIAGKTHGRIDWFEDIRDVGYWWQTAHESGSACSIDRAKRNVEEAVIRRCRALEARYLGDVVPENPAGAEVGASIDTGLRSWQEDPRAQGNVACST